MNINLRTFIPILIMFSVVLISIIELQKAKKEVSKLEKKSNKFRKKINKFEKEQNEIEEEVGEEIEEGDEWKMGTPYEYENPDAWKEQEER